MAVQPYLGEIRMFAGSFAPRGWAFCNGQLIPINQNTALFSILGTTYGGDGRTTFALPDLRGRVPLGPDQGPGLSPRVIGEAAGEENHLLSTSEMPAHTHSLAANSGNGNQRAPGGNVPAASDQRNSQYASSANTAMAAPAFTGSSLPHNNMQPYLAVTFIIALQGIFPSRN